MKKEDEVEWMDTLNNVEYNTGKLLMVLSKPVIIYGDETSN